jgi:hypothetical protein
VSGEADDDDLRAAMVMPIEHLLADFVPGVANRKKESSLWGRQWNASDRSEPIRLP